MSHWPLVAMHIPTAIRELRDLVAGDLPGVEDLIEARYLDGERRFRGEWLTRSPEWFDAEAAEELADWLTYRAMRHAREAMIAAAPPSG